MSKKKLIIILVFVAIIIGFVMYNSKKTTNENSTAANGDNSNYDYGGKEDNENGSNGGNSVDPQLKQTKPNSWYDITARTLADLSNGTTNSDDEESIINHISQCKTYQDIMLLTEAYSKYDSWTLQKMVNFELNGKGQKEKLNTNLKKNGCTYQF